MPFRFLRFIYSAGALASHASEANQLIFQHFFLSDKEAFFEPFPAATSRGSCVLANDAAVSEDTYLDPVWCVTYLTCFKNLYSFQWYMSPPLRVDDKVFLSDCVNGLYPIIADRFYSVPHFFCHTNALPVGIVGNLNTGMLIDNPVLRNHALEPAELLFCGPYLDENRRLISYQRQPSHLPLLRFETSFENPETPVFVEFLQTDPYKTADVKMSDNQHLFFTDGSGRQVWINRAVLPKHILIEGRMKTTQPWLLLDEVEIPKTFDAGFPLFELCYKREVKYLRFTITSIHYTPTYDRYDSYTNKSETVKNTDPILFYFPRTVFYPKNPKLI